MKSIKKKVSKKTVKKSVKNRTVKKIVGNHKTSKLISGGVQIKSDSKDNVLNVPLNPTTTNKIVETFETHHKKIVFPKSKVKTETERIIERHKIDVSKLPSNIIDDITNLIVCINKKGKKQKHDYTQQDTIACTHINNWIESEKKEAEPLEEKFCNNDISQDTKLHEQLFTKSNYPIVLEETLRDARNKSMGDITPKKPNNIIKKDPRLPAYSLQFTNKTNKPLKCTLFGVNNTLLAPNHSSDKGLEITSSNKNSSYFQAINQSGLEPIKTKSIKIISENYNQLLEDIIISKQDANGEHTETPIITKSFVDNSTKRVLSFDCETIIDGNTYFTFTVLPKTKGSILFFKEIVKEENNVPPVKVVSVTDMIILYNAIISCQIQQGLNFVSLKDVDKFTGSKAGSSIPVLDKIVEAGFVKTKQVNGEKQIGINVKMLTISGKTYTVNIKTAMQKSEYKVKK